MGLRNPGHAYIDSPCPSGQQSSGLATTDVAEALQSPHGRLVAHAEAPGERRHVLIGDRLRSRPRPQLGLHHCVIRNVKESLRSSAWRALVELAQMISNALGRHQERSRKCVRALLRELGRILPARRRYRLTAIEQRMGIFVSVGEPPPDRLVALVDQDRQADRGWLTNSPERPFGRSVAAVQMPCSLIVSATLTIGAMPSLSRRRSSWATASPWRIASPTG